ncbi:DUF2460 domain-containing protein [Qipengyuania sediminis]|uniref:DUF2460 domain-containing protein n=1 Tax=Qipengyuania sediminis TaxID=1532023 RepID=UPI00105AA349|nr:DUF2460 domain-containing protein [Qipengyuania sediminis]
MPFYLASHRHGAAGDHIARFDPRFWTVNFPRPMMASVVTPTPDALRVDCEFHHAGELAGLIWSSEDSADHPLLAYDTVRDYAQCCLRFRWRSAGVIPLDQPHGPTLTIEGRDAAGTPRAWYARLWNYAEGSPEDAVISLRFSDLQSGYGLPGEPVHVADIDRMFISLVPPGYVPGSTDSLPQRAGGWAELTEIACWGANALLPCGDAILPPHGIGMATAYDDAFDQAPARLVRQIEQLGYRGDVIHYVGMSHFFRLEPGEGGLLAAADGALCEPARAWHAAYFAALAEAGLTPIISLSYELFAAHCPAAWQQRAHDGAPARTGWEPPSALLSPANTEAMAWLQAVAREFIAMAEAAGCAVRFQIGEPWWWVQPQTGAICCYDDAARAALGNPVAIPDMRLTLSAAQKAVLDQAGALLAASTAALAQAVREVASGPAEVLLLAFTPTLLDPAMPELKRAALPAGWAWPAFDRLQLEDYDWLTAGAEGARFAAYAEVDARLGYPLAAQDYLAGFVLRPAEADAFWRRIDAGLEEAAARGVPRRFVWALPQIARDGFTRLPPPTEEPAMNAFDDVSYPLALGRDVQVSPEFSTGVAVTASGHERRNALWADARLRFDVGPGIRSEAELSTLIAFFRARHGPATGFRLRDPFDFSSNAMTGAPAMTDQAIGTGDGHRASFQLVKRYGEQLRTITRPDPDSIRVSVAGATASGWSHAGQGRIVFETAPPAGAAIRAGFLFDVPVRFAEDRLDVSGVNFAAGEAPSVPLVEIREEAA